MAKHSEETKEKMRLAWVRRRETFVPPFKGKKMPDAARAKMSASAKTRPSNRIGKKHTTETKERISEMTLERTPRGKDHYAWKGGATERSKNDRRRPEYFVWRLAVFTRDAFCCTKCSDSRGGNLRAHHVKPFSAHPDLRYEVSNGVTLCHTCHELEHFKPDSIRNTRKLKRGERLWQ